MNILGLVSETHDTGLALLRDGKIELVIEEERLSRQKHTLDFPSQAVTALFGDGVLRLSDIDVITVPWDPKRLRQTFAKTVFTKLPYSLNLLRPSARPTQDQGLVIINYWIRRTLKEVLGVKAVPEIVNVAHHDAHAAMFFVSPFEEATVLVMDGYGDDAATSVYTGRGNRLNRHWHSEFLDSLGIVYTVVTKHLGFAPFEEGTVMALAALGGDRYVERFRELIRLEDDGGYRVNTDYFSYDRYGFIQPFTPKFVETFGPARQRGEPLTERHHDLAHALQVMIEDAVLHIVRNLERKHRTRNLCLSGGVALNCVANARILEKTGFEKVWVPPCASDTGAPLGSALWHWHETLGNRNRTELTHAFYGLEYTPEQIKAALDEAGLSYERLSESDMIGRVAKDLSENRIVGWFQGRFEMGPRALGNRSIIASPLNPGVKELMNKRVKYREPFRPFAPAVLAERAADYFEIAQADPFMTMAPRVKADKAREIPAAVHVDGTARIQTVERAANPRYYGVIEEFERLTGVPVILNTSFNKQEPVVARPAEAISCYLRTEIDVLAIGDFYTRDRNPSAVERFRAAFQVHERNKTGGE